MNNYKLSVRSSKAKAFMTKGRNKSDVFGETALEYIYQNALAQVFNLYPEVSTKQMDKGNMVEADSIEMLNRNWFRNYKKNEVRMLTDRFTGECDIHSESESLIIDIKNAWDWTTFCWTKSQLDKVCHKSGYIEQLRMYMMLYRADYAQVVQTLLDTPMELLGAWDDPSQHEYDHIPELARITATDPIKRDLLWEEELNERYELAEPIFNQFVNEILSKYENN